MEAEVGCGEGAGAGMKTGDVLNGALEELKIRGWCRGELSNSHGSVCCLGALNAYLWGMPERHVLGGSHYELRTRALEALVNQMPEDVREKIVCMPTVMSAANVETRVAMMVMEYNDSERTYLQIKELFEKAAANEGYLVE